MPASVHDLTLTADNIDIDTNLVNTTGTQTYNGNISDVLTNVEFRTTGTSEDIIFNDDANIPFADVVINATGDIFAKETFIVNSFTLSNGTWQQSVDENPLLSSLPVFSANDFTLNGGTFKRFTGGLGI